MRTFEDLKNEIRGWDLETFRFVLGCHTKLTWLIHTTYDPWMVGLMFRLRPTDTLYVLTGDTDMARNQQRSSTFMGFKNVTLDADAMADYERQLIKNKVTMNQSVAAILSHGKFSLSFKDGTYTATVTAEHDGGIWGLSAFSDDIVDATNLLAYKLTIAPNWLTSESPKVRKRG